MALGQAPAWGAQPSIKAAHLEVDRAPQAQALPTATINQIKALVAERTRQAVAMTQTAGILLLDAQMGTLQQRMWELRDGRDGGLWVRLGGTDYHADTTDTPAFKERLKYGSVGGDYGWKLGNGSLFLGGYVGMGKADVHDGGPLHGKIKNYYAGSYLTYFEPEGWYVDLATRVGRMDLDFKVEIPEINKTYDADDKHAAFTGSIETGYHFALPQAWFIEPQAQLLYEHSSQHSVIGRLGVRAGRDFALSGGGNLRPYMTLSYLAQLSNDDTVDYGGEPFKAALPGNRWRVGGGIALDSGPHRAFADLRYGHGSDISRELTLVLGYSYRF
ncbi:autotransporter beta-domain protein [Bordetella hinzii 5132]|uniref:autotransporter outer membrane beta-barrel domain-containing protein n=1 Tax=Bordetella hinzii TaxID=103855 RepID=UPI00045A53BA|nr:autotransporter outer membrane beta-barrel domain-containing protein [Bordetella hinzii]KCB43680.1 autotransporter beta-domain protein [Bordetella hinzii 5132]